MVTVDEIIKKYPHIVFHIHTSKTEQIIPMPKEVESGNTEYKRCLNDDSQQKLSKLATQMKWRILEALTHGKKSAIYYIGVDDNGEIVGLTNDQLKMSVKNLIGMTKHIRASVNKIIIIKYHMFGPNGNLENEIQIVKALVKLNEVRKEVTYFD